MDKIQEAFNVCDRGHLGTLSKEQLVNIIKSFGLYEALRPVLPRILDRCDKNGRVDWLMALRFLEKSQPLGVVRKGGGRRDMQSSNSNPLPAPPSPLRPIPQKPESAQPVSERTVEAKEEAREESREEAREDRRLQRLDQLEEHIRALSIHSEQLRHELESDTERVSGGARLMDALQRFDKDGTRWISASKARQTMQQYNDLHQLGLHSRFVNSVLALAADDSERSVSLDVLHKYLNPAAT